MEHNCLNCNTALSSNFCQNCGQKATTHRYSLKHFVQHDLIHGIFHLEKGILFTIKQLFTRPGHIVREYVNGKRAYLFNFVPLIILIITVASLLTPFIKIRIIDLMSSSAQSKAMMSAIDKFSAEYPKIIALITIPIAAAFSYLFFRKAKFNFTEHLVLNAYSAASLLLINILFTIFSIFCANPKILLPTYSFISLLLFLYTFWIYFQFFSTSSYKKSSLIFRSIFATFGPIFFSIVVGIVIGVVKIITHLKK